METTGTPATGAIFGVRIHEPSSSSQLRASCEAFLEGAGTARIFTLNPEILLRAREDPSYAGVLNTADLALPDGTGVALVESLRGRRRVRRWPGVDLAATLVRLAARRGATVVLFGGAPEVAARAAARWRASAAPGLRIEAVGAGPIGDDGRPTVAGDGAVEQVRAIAPTIVLVALGSPKQERWIDLHASEVPSARIMMAVGGTFDMWAGALRRAPRWMRRVGLEWVWRLALEPHRWHRIVRATILFPARALLDRRP